MYIKKIFVHLNQQINENSLKDGILNIFSRSNKCNDFKIKFENSYHILILKSKPYMVFNQNLIFLNPEILHFLEYKHNTFDFQSSKDYFIKRKINKKIKDQKRKILVRKIKKIYYSKADFDFKRYKHMILTTNYRVYLYIFVIFLLDSLQIIRISEFIFTFLTDEPLKIKQNKLITLYLGKYLLKSIPFYSDNLRNLPNFLKTAILFIHVTQIMVPISIYIYNKCINLILQLFDILMSRNYNQLKNRVDRIEFKYDRAVVATLILSIMFLMIYNIIGFYILFAAIFCILDLLKLSSDFIDCMLIDMNQFKCNIEFLKSNENERHFFMVYEDVKIMKKIEFCLTYAWKISRFSKINFLQQLLTGGFYNSIS